MNESARTWGLRLLALSIAVGVWFSVSFEDREALSERMVEASVSYNRLRGFVILDPVGTVNVRLRRAPGEWNSMDVLVRGGCVDVTINGDVLRIRDKAWRFEFKDGVRGERLFSEWKAAKLPPVTAP